MKLHEIIKLIDETQQESILVEELYKYRKSLHIWYSNHFIDMPVLMVTDVFNACQYATIVPASELTESICAYLGDWDCVNEDSANYGTYETICFNSIPLSDFAETVKSSYQEIGHIIDSLNSGEIRDI